MDEPTVYLYINQTISKCGEIKWGKWAINLWRNFYRGSISLWQYVTRGTAGLEKVKSLVIKFMNGLKLNIVDFFWFSLTFDLKCTSSFINIFNKFIKFVFTPLVICSDEIRYQSS